MLTAGPSRARRAAVFVLTLAVSGSLLTAGYAVAAGKKDGGGGGGGCKHNCSSSDTTAPTVSILAPSPNSSLGGTVTVSGSASDNVAVASVAVSVDGGPYSGASGSSSWSYQLDTAAYLNGTHTINARAMDSSGNSKVTSEFVNISNSAPSPSSSPTPTPSPTSTSSPTPTPSPTSAASTPTHMVTPEGVTIDIDSAGSWTTDQIYSMLKASARDLTTIGPLLTIKVQDTYASATSTSASTSGGRYVSFGAIIYLKGINSNFSVSPDAGIAHEYGHVWTLYNLYITHNGDWSSYLNTRWAGLDGSVLANSPFLDSSYTWMKTEIIADDYRLLFGSSLAKTESPQHLNTAIPDPRNQPGLDTWLLNIWG